MFPATEQISTQPEQGGRNERDSIFSDGGVRDAPVDGSDLIANIYQAAAQPFPSRTITIVVPTAPATPPDIISRVIATELSESEGWSVIVENKAGAVLTLGGAEVLKHPPDGHSIYAMALPVSAAPAFLPNMPFRLETDFAPVIKLSTSYNVLVVNPAFRRSRFPNSLHW